MINTKTIKVKLSENVSSYYIEEQLMLQGYDVLRWAITEVDDEFYTLDVAVIE